MATNSLVSVIIPAFNASNVIEQSVDSVLQQSYKNIEIIIVDDGSKDNTLEVLAKYNDDRVKVIPQPNRGAAIARQKGLELSCGEYIQFLDADDILHPSKIERQINALNNLPHHIAVCKTAHFFNNANPYKDNIPDDDAFFQEYLSDPVRFVIKLYGGFDLIAGMIQPNAFLAPRSVIENAGPWNKDLAGCPDDDGEYFCRVILNSKGIVYQSDILNYYRKYHTQTSLSRKKDEAALSKIFLSLKLKHQHLLHAADSSLVPYIHAATYRWCKELRIRSYPQFKALGNQIEAFMQTLLPHKKADSYNFGRDITNFIGNNISWKLMRHLQHLRRRSSL